MRPLRPSATLALAFALALAPAAATLSGCSADAPSDIGLAALSADWTTLPVISAARYQRSTSTQVGDETVPIVDPGNKDFNNFVAVCGAHPETIYQRVADASGAACAGGVDGHVIYAADDGPGYLSRVFMAVSSPLSAPALAQPNGPRVAGLDAEVLAIYVDDLSAPAYRVALRDWGDGSDRIFAPPLAAWLSGALVSYVPVSYRARVRVALEHVDAKKLYYYAVEARVGGAGDTTPFSSHIDEQPAWTSARARLQRLDDAPDVGPDDAALERVADERALALAPGKTVTVIDQPGPAQIGLLSLSVADPITPEALGALQLLAHFDGAQDAAIDVPLAALFAVESKLAALRTLPLRVSHDGARWRFSLHLPMPFAQRAVIELRNDGADALSMSATVGVRPDLPAGDWGHLHALHHETRAPVGADDRYLVADITGRGRYVGTVATLAGQRDPDSTISHPLNFLEGDDLMDIDGRSSQGTGSEDYFNAGWYFYNGPYDAALSAVDDVWRDADGAQARRGRTSQLRWHILGDAIAFERSFRLRFEYGANKPATLERYGSVALYYLAP